MMQGISMDVLEAISQRTGRTFNDLLDNLTAQLLGSIQSKMIFNQDAIADEVILKADEEIKPILKNSLLRVDVSVSFSVGTPKIQVRTTKDNEDKDTFPLDGTAFTTLVSKSFDKQLMFSNKYNFLFDTDCKIDYLVWSEIPVNS